MFSCCISVVTWEDMVYCSPFPSDEVLSALVFLKPILGKLQSIMADSLLKVS